MEARTPLSLSATAQSSELAENCRQAQALAQTLQPGRHHQLDLSIHLVNLTVVLPLATFGQIKAGTSARIRTEAGHGHDAKVKVVDRVFDAASGTYGVQLELPNPAEKIPGGPRCRVDFPGLGGMAATKGTTLR